MTDQAAVGNVVEGVQLSLVALCLLAGVVLLHRRRRGPGRSPRRPATLVVDAFSIALIMLAVLYIAGHLRLAVRGDAPADHLRLPGPGSDRLPLSRCSTCGSPAATSPGCWSSCATTRPPICRRRWPVRSATRLCACTTGCRSWARGPISTASRPPSRAPTSGRAVRILLREQEPMAALSFDRSLEDEHELLDAVVATAGIALENGRLRAELRARLQDLQGSRVRVLEAGRQERQRLERDLHDGAQVRLVALSLELGSAGRGSRHRPVDEDTTARGQGVGIGVAAGTAGRRARHLPGRAERSRTGGGARIAGRTSRRAGPPGRRPARPPAGGRRGRGLLRRQRSTRQHRQALVRHPGSRCAS